MKYFPIIFQAKYQAKVDELAKMRRSASPDPTKVLQDMTLTERIFLILSVMFLSLI